MDEDQTSLDNVDLYEDLHELFSSSRSVTDCSLSYAEVSIHKVLNILVSKISYFTVQLQEKLKEKETQLNALKLEVWFMEMHSQKIFVDIIQFCTVTLKNI